MWRIAVQVLLFSLGSLCYSLLNVLSQLSKSPDGSYAYSMPSVVLTAEACKLMLSSFLLSVERRSPVAAVGEIVTSGSIWSWIVFAVPSALYSLNNNLDMLNNQHMDPATEQVLVQCKILTTGIVWWLVFREPLGARKWLSLVLLFIGAVLAGTKSEALLDAARTMYIDATGVFLVFLYVWVSASAGVYNEWLVKGYSKGESIHVCNARIYAIGVLVNGTAHILGGEALTPGEFFKGYNVYVWGLVATYTMLGVLLAQVMKWFDNIVKLFISGCSMYISAILSYTIFGYAPTFNFVMALVLVSFAMVLFNLEKIVGATKKKEA